MQQVFFECIVIVFESSQMTSSCIIARFTSDMVIDIGHFLGPKGAVCLALTSKILMKLSPIDQKGITEKYIRSLPCPCAIDAGIVGISVHDRIELDEFGEEGNVFGFITHIQEDMFVMRLESGDEKLIGFQSIMAVNNESFPVDMPCLVPELIFLMMRQETPGHILERMLYFLVRHGKSNLVSEMILRMKLTSELLGRVLLMLWLHGVMLDRLCEPSVISSQRCCQMLVDSGATVAEKDGVEVQILCTDGTFLQKYIRCKSNVYFQQWSTHYVNAMNDWSDWNYTASAMLADGRSPHAWFPLQFNDNCGLYMGPDKRFFLSARENGEWEIIPDIHYPFKVCPIDVHSWPAFFTFQ